MPVAVLLVAVAAVSQELGAAFAVKLFSALGPLGAVFVRLAVAGVVLCSAMRPRLSGLPRRSWHSAAGLAAALVVMNACFYFAIDRIPLGVAVTIEVLGPLVLSVAIGSRRTAWLWALLAFAGVAILGLTQPRETMDPGRVCVCGGRRRRVGGLHSGDSPRRRGVSPSRRTGGRHSARRPCPLPVRPRPPSTRRQPPICG